MTSTPRSLAEESLNGSWVELHFNSREGTESCNTPVNLPTNVEKLLLEAQHDSNLSSLVGSSVSQKGSPRILDSPVSEQTSTDVILINKEVLSSADWIWDWSSRPDQLPPKQWKFKHPQKPGLSLRHSKALKHGLFSSHILSILVLTNILSLLLGAGIGLFIGRRVSSIMPL